MGTIIKQYDFDRICSQMEKEFGKIRKGQEQNHEYVLMTIESNLLKTHRLYPDSNSRRAIEAIAIALFQIKGYLQEEEFNVDRYKSEDNERLTYAILMAFDPFTNTDISVALKEKKMNIDLDNQEELKAYFREPVICLLRVRESVESWVERAGADGYFDFLENAIGATVPQDEKLNFTVMF